MPANTAGCHCVRRHALAGSAHPAAAKQAAGHALAGRSADLRTIRARRHALAGRSEPFRPIRARRHALAVVIASSSQNSAARHALTWALGSVGSLWPCRHAYTRCGRPAGAKRDFPQAPRVRSAAVDAPQGACVGRALVTTRWVLVFYVHKRPAIGVATWDCGGDLGHKTPKAAPPWPASASSSVRKCWRRELPSYVVGVSARAALPHSRCFCGNGA